jgi:signal transduction histidine kinase
MTTKGHLSKHDREIAGIWDLMGKLAKGTLAAQEETRQLRALIGETQREMRSAIKELAAAQKRTEATLRTFIASLRGGNGHRKRNVP